MEGTIATIMMFAGNFAPQNWAFCDGSILAISEYDALFSLLGTTYGGDGRTTFALPDLRGRVPVGVGQGAGLSNVQLGEKAGSEQFSLTTAQMPAHQHQMTAKVGVTSASVDGSNSPLRVLATPGVNIYTAPANATPAHLGGVSITLQNTGSNLPVNNVQAYQAINYVICLVGIYPSRS